MPDTLDRLLLDELRRTYGADRQILRAWPKLGAAAQARALKRLCREGVSYTERRLKRLETAFEELGARPKPLRSGSMWALIREALQVAGRTLEPAERDAALIARIQGLSHHGQASYISLVALAQAAGHPAVVRLLRPSLKDKREAIAEMRGMATDELYRRLR